jgi:hypothetical protein
MLHVNVKREPGEGRSEMHMNPPQSGLNKAERQTDPRALEPIPQLAGRREVQLRSSTVHKTSE